MRNAKIEACALFTCPYLRIVETVSPFYESSDDLRISVCQLIGPFNATDEEQRRENKFPDRCPLVTISQNAKQATS